VEKEKIQGTVKFFNPEKGFGFIKSDNSSEDVFVHATGLVDEIKENDQVEFELQQGRKGMNAVNVTIVR
jgi:CspA family cold shock protein